MNNPMASEMGVQRSFCEAIIFVNLMSALGHKRTLQRHNMMSALPAKADIGRGVLGMNGGIHQNRKNLESSGDEFRQSLLPPKLAGDHC
jgi:hypothetical protein